MNHKPLRKQDTTIIWSEEDNAFLASCAHFTCHGDSRQEAFQKRCGVNPSNNPNT